MAAPINVDWDAAESELAQQEKMLWNAEWELRVRCDKLTPIEAKEQELRNPRNWGNDKQCETDSIKLSGYFGAMSGAASACKRMLKYLHGKENWKPGQVAKWYSVGFTLGKHLLLSERNQMELDAEDHPNVIKCFCFSKTYVMGAGCAHKQTPTSSVSVMSATLCPTCSTCLRCIKLLV